MRATRVRRFGVVLLVLFGVQFAVGMLLNLFVELPTSHPGSAGDEYFARSAASLLWSLSGRGGPALLVHALLGAAAAVGSIVLFVLCVARRVRGWRWLSGLAALFTVGAFFNGMSFVDYGEDFSSAIMAGCWLLAVACLVAALVRHPGWRGTRA
ncbi:MAG: hypothetical protein ACTHMF_10530 [Leifsonia sp.]|uniref:hypothetical protein n=1 Tax=Leifsonia sp. TaxID=1870902 RepID=UPI003F8178A5